MSVVKAVRLSGLLSQEYRRTPSLLNYYINYKYIKVINPDVHSCAFVLVFFIHFCLCAMFFFVLFFSCGVISVVFSGVVSEQTG